MLRSRNNGSELRTEVTINNTTIDLSREVEGITLYTRIELSHENFIEMAHEMIDEYVETDCILAATGEEEMETGITRMKYDTKNKRLSFEILHDGDWFMVYRFKISFETYESLFSRVLNEIFDINTANGMRLFIGGQTNLKPEKMFDLFKSGAAEIGFYKHIASAFIPLTEKVTGQKSITCSIQIRQINRSVFDRFCQFRESSNIIYLQRA